MSGKTAIVTGAGSHTGLGRQICLTLAGEGVDIVANDTNLEWAEQTANEVAALGRQALAVKADITKVAEVNEMVKAALDRFGKIDILVNNAGVISRDAPFSQISEKDCDRMIDVNLKGVLNCTRAVYDHMAGRKYGKIINIASIAGKYGAPNAAVYCATKAAVVNFTRATALELIPYGVNVNCVCPGAIPTTGLYVEAAPGTKEKLVASIPRGVPGKTEDIANMVAYLASDISVHIVAQAINVDGGKAVM